jgi:protein-S-isoprenylcysteine O-methyltransferase Ste14
MSKGAHLVAIQLLLMAGFALMPPWPEAPEYLASGPFILLRRVLLSLCWVSSLLFGYGGSRSLGRNLTPIPYPVDDNQLVESGVYRLVRHPLYTAILLGFTGWSLFTASAAHVGLTAVAYAFFTYKSFKEEAWLSERHPGYEAYARRTGRFLPGIRTSGRLEEKDNRD